MTSDIQKNALQGVGIGLRSRHYTYIETEQPQVPWFEILSDNYLNLSGPSLHHLEKICASYPVTLHGVGMSLGSTDPLNVDYLKKLAALIKLTQPQLVSDHLCWTVLSGRYFHELLPLPYTTEVVTHVANRIKQVQDFLGKQIMIENVSSYLQFSHSSLKEWEFLNAIAEEADCLILLDINNIYVSAYNNHFLTADYLNGVNPKRIAQFHLAGYCDYGTYLLDTHGDAIQAPVWELFADALKRFGPIPTVIERDNNIPEFQVLFQEAKQAQMIMENYAAIA
ncbi:MAG: MNIO family bufferin maturase [Gammaproteobacteria bacterium]